MTTQESGSSPDKPADKLSGRAKQELRAMPRWKKILLGCAALFVVVGVVLMFVETPSETPSGGGGSTGIGPSSSFVGEGDQGPGAQSASQSGDAWSAGFFRLGFSFFAGFAIGYALRSFLKISLIVIGISLLLLFGLSYIELIEVHWDKIDGMFESLVERFKGESARFKSFITGSLPSAGLASLGLVAGLKKN